MPRPQKDWRLEFKREFEKLTEQIAKLEKRRQEVVDGFEGMFHEPFPLPKEGSKAPRSTRRANA